MVGGSSVSRATGFNGWGAREKYANGGVSERGELVEKGRWR